MTEMQLLYLSLGGVFLAATALGYWGLTMLSPRRGDARLRAQGLPSAGTRIVQEETGLSRVMSTLPDRLAPTDLIELNKLRRLLAKAGYRSRSAVRNYYGARILVGVGALWIFVLFVFVSGGQFEARMILLGMFGSTLLGFMLPHVFVWSKGNERAELMGYELPDALDLMLVCVESGLGVDAALARVGDEMRVSHPRIAEEFQTASLELRAGRSRDEVLERMASRAGLTQLTNFASLLIQASRLGASISDALRVAADDLRHRRLMAAEEKAAKLPVKMMVPMIVFLMPVILIITATPAIIRALEQVGPMLGR